MSSWTLGFKPARYDQAGSGNDYIGCHTEDLLIVAENAQKILDSLMKIYEVSNPGPPVYHLGCSYSKVVDKGEEFCCIGSSTHVKEALIKTEEIQSKLYNIQGIENLDRLPNIPNLSLLLMFTNSFRYSEGDIE